MKYQVEINLPEDVTAREMKSLIKEAIIVMAKTCDLDEKDIKVKEIKNEVSITNGVKCLIKDCNNSNSLTGSRGLCNSCYQMAIRDIRKGKTTWKELIKLGLAKDKYIRKGKFDKAFRGAKNGS